MNKLLLVAALFAGLMMFGCINQTPFWFEEKSEKSITEIVSCFNQECKYFCGKHANEYENLSSYTAEFHPGWLALNHHDYELILQGYYNGEENTFMCDCLFTVKGEKQAENGKYTFEYPEIYLSMTYIDSNCTKSR